MSNRMKKILFYGLQIVGGLLFVFLTMEGLLGGAGFGAAMASAAFWMAWGDSPGGTSAVWCNDHSRNHTVSHLAMAIITSVVALMMFMAASAF